MTTAPHLFRLTALLGLFVSLTACGDAASLTRSHITKGDRFFSEKKYDEASIEYRVALQKTPQLAEGYYKLGQSLAAKSDVVGALAAYVRAADLEPTLIDAQLKASNLLLLARKYDDANTRLRAVLKQDPSNSDALLMLGNALAGLGSLEEAVAANQRAIALDPKRAGMYINLGALQYMHGNKPEAEAAYLAAVKVDPTSADARVGLADYYSIVGRTAEAERTYLEALKLKNDDPNANRVVANFYIRTGRLAQAEPYLRKRTDVLKSPEAWYDLVDYYVATKRNAMALKILERLRQQPVTYAEATVRTAFMDAVADQPTMAMTLVDEVIAKNPLYAPALALKTHLLLADRKRLEAFAASEQAVRADPKSEAAHFAHAAAAAAVGKPDVAQAALLEVLKLNPSSTEATIELARVNLSQGLIDAALQYAEEAVAQNPNLVEARLVRLRAIARHSGERDRAAKELAFLVTKYPNSPTVQYEAGVVAVGSLDNAGAYKYFTRARELAPGYREPLVGLIKLDIAARNLAQAKRRVDDLIAKYPASADALLIAGTTYAMIDPAVAERDLRKVIDLDPSNITAYEALAALFLTQNRLDQAREEFIALSEKQPNTVAPVTMVGIIYDVQGRKPDAEHWYQAAIKIDSRAATAANNLAWNYAERGEQLETALDLAQTAHRELPDQAEVTDTLGWVSLKKGLIPQAVRTLKVAVEQDPKSALYHYHLGLAYAQNGEDGRAKQSLQQALAVDPKFPQAPDVHRALAKLLY